METKFYNRHDAYVKLSFVTGVTMWLVIIRFSVIVQLYL